MKTIKLIAAVLVAILLVIPTSALCEAAAQAANPTLTARWVSWAVGSSEIGPLAFVGSRKA